MAARRDASDVTRLRRLQTVCDGRGLNRGDRSFSSSGFTELLLCRTLAFAFTKPGAVVTPAEPEPVEYSGGGVINDSTNFVGDGGPLTTDWPVTWTGGDVFGCTPTQCW